MTTTRREIRVRVPALLHERLVEIAAREQIPLSRAFERVARSYVAREASRRRVALSLVADGTETDQVVA